MGNEVSSSAQEQQQEGTEGNNQNHTWNDSAHQQEQAAPIPVVTTKPDTTNEHTLPDTLATVDTLPTSLSSTSSSTSSPPRQSNHNHHKQVFRRRSSVPHNSSEHTKIPSSPIRTILRSSSMPDPASPLSTASSQASLGNGKKEKRGFFRRRKKKPDLVLNTTTTEPPHAQPSPLGSTTTRSQEEEKKEDGVLLPCTSYGAESIPEEEGTETTLDEDGSATDHGSLGGTPLASSAMVHMAFPDLLGPQSSAEPDDENDKKSPVAAAGAPLARDLLHPRPVAVRPALLSPEQTDSVAGDSVRSTSSQVVSKLLATASTQAADDDDHKDRAVTPTPIIVSLGDVISPASAVPLVSVPVNATSTNLLVEEVPAVPTSTTPTEQGAPPSPSTAAAEAALSPAAAAAAEVVTTLLQQQQQQAEPPLAPPSLTQSSVAAAASLERVTDDPPHSSPLKNTVELDPTEALRQSPAASPTRSLDGSTAAASSPKARDVQRELDTVVTPQVSPVATILELSELLSTDKSPELRTLAPHEGGDTAVPQLPEPVSQSAAVPPTTTTEPVATTKEETIPPPVSDEPQGPPTTITAPALHPSPVASPKDEDDTTRKSLKNHSPSAAFLTSSSEAVEKSSSPPTATVTTTTSSDSVSAHSTSAAAAMAMASAQQALVVRKKTTADIIRSDLWSPNEATVLAALQHITMEAASDKARSLIARTGGLLAVVRAMESHATHSDIQVAGCQALEKLALDTDNEIAIEQVGGVETILAAMMGHFANAAVHEAAWAALWNLTCTNATKDMTLDTDGGMAAIVQAMQHHRSSPAVQKNACGALANLCQNNPKRLQAFAKANGFGVMAQALQDYWNSDADVRSEACFAMTALCEGSANQLHAARTTTLTTTTALNPAAPALLHHSHSAPIPSSSGGSVASASRGYLPPRFTGVPPPSVLNLRSSSTSSAAHYHATTTTLGAMDSDLHSLASLSYFEEEVFDD